MKKCLYLLMILISVPCFAGIGEEFDQLVEAYGEKYFELRERLLQNPEIKDYVRSLLQDDALPQLKKAQAFILLEWLDNKEAIREVLSASHVRTSYRGRYPSWDSTSAAHARAREKLMTVYLDNECPWFILECIWKFSGIDENLVVKPFSNLPEYTKHNADYIFFGMREGMPEDQVYIYASALEHRLNYSIAPDSSLKDTVRRGTDRLIVEKISFFGHKKSYKSIMNWLMSLDLETRRPFALLFLFPVTHKENIDDVRKFFNEMIIHPDASTSIREYILEFFDVIENDRHFSEDWIYLCYKYTFDRKYFGLIEPLIYRINPSMKGRIVRNEGPDGGIIILDAPKEPDQNNHENE